MRKNLSLILLLIFVFGYGCSSGSKKGEPKEDKKVEGRVFHKTFKLLNAKTKLEPSWLNDPQGWAKKYDKKDSKKMRYFAYNTEVKKRRGIACQLAKAKASAAIASEITQFIKQSFGQSVQGDPTDNDDALEEYVESTLAQEVQSFIVGARIHRTYWEHRAYREELGADDNFTGYTCSALVKMHKKNLKKAIKRAQKKLEDSTDNPETKQNVRKALKDADEKFNKL